MNNDQKTQSLEETLNAAQEAYAAILAECGVETIQQVIESHHMLREVAVEIGFITDLDRSAFDPDDRIEVAPTFDLAARIADHFGEKGRCAACSPNGSKTAVAWADGGK